jgi:hypothetical protein
MSYKYSAANLYWIAVCLPPCISLQSCTRCSYFSFFLGYASSILTSQGTANYTITSCLVFLDRSNMSGRNLVSTMSCGNLGVIFRSTNNSQSSAVARVPVAAFVCSTGTVSPAFMNCMYLFIIAAYLPLILNQDSDWGQIIAVDL